MSACRAAPLLLRLPGWLRGSIGMGIWAVGLFLVHPTPFDRGWASAMLLLATLVLVPFGMDLAAMERAAGDHEPFWHFAMALQLPAALCVGIAFFLPQGALACCLAVPWLTTTAVMAACGLLRLWHRGFAPLYGACVDLGLVYSAVGGGWVCADRLGMRPLQFDAVIVLLTAIHFHYAGFLLPVLTGLALRRYPGRTGALGAIAVTAGVPFVALGITTTQLGAAPLTECAAAWLLAAGGTITAWLHLRLALQTCWPRPVRILWLITGASLFGSMVLAATYGARFYVPVPWLDIPWMRALHGTANALGFGLAGVLGWRWALAGGADRALMPPRA